MAVQLILIVLVTGVMGAAVGTTVLVATGVASYRRRPFQREENAMTDRYALTNDGEIKEDTTVIAAPTTADHEAVARLVVAANLSAHYNDLLDQIGRIADTRNDG